MKIVRILLGVILAVFACLSAYLFVGLESYCVIYPSIDTRYAPGFSEPKFAQVKIGMTREEVLKLLGPPLGATSSNRWSYTQDGKCRWADWAWLGREVIFRDDHVVEKVARVWYD
jgi:outer membrane protein assembly factor BamE (lipoprotein component of BamABCDE complex)